MRKFLDGLYTGSSWLAGLGMIGVLLMVSYSIVGRLAGFPVGGIDAYAGYLMAGAGFLALAHTLKRAEHIRVTLVLQNLPPAAQRWLERWAMGAAALLALLFAWYSVRLAWQSFDYHDISTSNDATPLWIPQLSMALGVVVFAIAAIDEFVIEWRGRPARAAGTEALRHE